MTNAGDKDTCQINSFCWVLFLKLKASTKLGREIRGRGRREAIEKSQRACSTRKNCPERSAKVNPPTNWNESVYKKN